MQAMPASWKTKSFCEALDSEVPLQNDDTARRIVSSKTAVLRPGSPKHPKVMILRDT